MTLQAAGEPTMIASPTPSPQTATIAQIIDGYKGFQALQAGYRSGLFDWLDQHGPAQRPAIAEALGLRGAHLGAFLQALQDLGLLEREGMAYRLSPDMDRVLCADSSWDLGGALDELSAPGGGWSDLGRFMSQDWVQAPPQPTTLARAPLLAESQSLLDYLSNENARYDLAKARSLVCFDGSHGLLGAAIRRRFPRIEITIVVPPQAMARAEALLRELGADAHRHIVAGTPLEPPAAQSFDYAILFHSLYPVRKSTDAALAQICASLTPGGVVCLAHWFCLEACETTPGGLRDLDKAILTDSHPLCGVERFCQRMEQAGLDAAERHDLPGEYGNTKLHFARKPGIERAA
jgi:hypothetical protein